MDQAISKFEDLSEEDQLAAIRYFTLSTVQKVVLGVMQMDDKKNNNNFQHLVDQIRISVPLDAPISELFTKLWEQPIIQEVCSDIGRSMACQTLYTNFPVLNLAYLRNSILEITQANNCAKHLN